MTTLAFVEILFVCLHLTHDHQILFSLVPRDDDGVEQLLYDRRVCNI